MKNLSKIFAGFLALFLLMNCTSQKPDYAKLHRQWMLVEFKNFSKDFLVKNKANLDLSATKSPKNQYNAFMGCNRMFMTADFQAGGRAEFSKVNSTMMLCQENMELEMAFATELPKMKHYKIDGHFLTLSAENGEKMKFIAADWD